MIQGLLSQIRRNGIARNDMGLIFMRMALMLVMIERLAVSNYWDGL